MALIVVNGGDSAHGRTGAVTVGVGADPGVFALGEGCGWVLGGVCGGGWEGEGGGAEEGEEDGECEMHFAWCGDWEICFD